MSISHELSGEIATALFTEKERSPGELKDLRDIVFKVHSTLEELAKKSRAHRHLDLVDAGVKSDRAMKKSSTTSS